MGTVRKCSGPRCRPWPMRPAYRWRCANERYRHTHRALLPWARAARPAAPVRVHAVDQALVWLTVALLAFGLVMVYSASVALPDNPRFANYAHGHFLFRH